MKKFIIVIVLEQFKETMQRIAALHLQMSALMNFTDKGIVLDTKVTANGKAAKGQGTD